MAARNKRGIKQERIDVAAPIRRALYLRVSTEDQAERGTIRAQLDFLRQRAELDNKSREMQGLPPIIIAGEYPDDGISGATPLGERPEGGRLLADARSGLFDEVMVYRLDRLGRRLRVLMDAHDSLEDAGCTIISATEPFDTSTPFGKAMFQFLGLMAELERSTIADRMHGGRDTRTRGGKWTNGPVPFGYDLDDQGCLIPSERIVPGTGMTEAEIAYQVFDRLAHREKETLFTICRWLEALGVPTASRYAKGTVDPRASVEWKPGRIYKMVHNPIYAGRRVFESRMGRIEHDVPAIVTADLQEAAKRRLTQNTHLPSHASRFNLLRGLVTCGSCGLNFVGVRAKGAPYYRCNGQQVQVALDPAQRCKAKMIKADELEGRIKDYVRDVARDPMAEIEEIQRQARDRAGKSIGLEVQREVLAQRIRELTGERDRIMTLYKRGMIDLDEAERQLADTAQTLGAARAELEGIRAQQELTEASESMVISAAAALRVLAERFEDASPEEQREIIGRLIPRIVIHTIELPERVGRATKDYQIEIEPIAGMGLGAVKSTRS